MSRANGWLVLGLLAFLGAPQANAAGSLMSSLGLYGGLGTESWCQTSYRSDSYGRGLEAAFKGQNLRPSFADDGCYQLGVARGEELKKGTVGFDSRDCERSFEMGQAHGFAALVPTAGNECFNAGVAAGTADLVIAAREGDKGTVGVTCVDEYLRGRGDGRSNRVAQPTLDARDATCYSAGFTDGSLLRI